MNYSPERFDLNPLEIGTEQAVTFPQDFDQLPHKLDNVEPRPADSNPAEGEV